MKTSMFGELLKFPEHFKSLSKIKLDFNFNDLYIEKNPLNTNDSLFVIRYSLRRIPNNE